MTKVLRYFCTHLIWSLPACILKRHYKDKKGAGENICTATSAGVFDEQTMTLIYSLRAHAVINRDYKRLNCMIYATANVKLLLSCIS